MKLFYYNPIIDMRTISYKIHSWEIQVDITDGNVSCGRENVDIQHENTCKQFSTLMGKYGNTWVFETIWPGNAKTDCFYLIK